MRLAKRGGGGGLICYLYIFIFIFSPDVFQPGRVEAGAWRPHGSLYTTYVQGGRVQWNERCLCEYDICLEDCASSALQFYLSRLDLCEGGSISTWSTDGDIQLSVSSLWCCILCWKFTHCFVKNKKCSFLMSCVFWFVHTPFGIWTNFHPGWLQLYLRKYASVTWAATHWARYQYYPHSKPISIIL